MNLHNPFLHYIKNKDGTGLGIPSDSNSWYRKNVIRNQILFPYLYSLPLLVLFEAIPCGVTHFQIPKNAGEGNNFVTFYSLSVERLACFAIVLYVVTQHSPCLWEERYVTFERIARKETIKIKGTCPPFPHLFAP